MVARTINDPSGLNAELVERLVGLTAYDVVKLVASYLPEINLLAPNAEAITAIGAELENLILLVPELEALREIADNLEEIINGEKPASSITYNGTTLDLILANLLYQPITVSSYVATPNVAEAGSAVSSIALAWVLSRSGTVQKVNGQTIPNDDRSFTSNVPIGSTTDYVLHVEDGDRVTESIATVTFKRKRYWGTSASASLSDTEILAMSSEFADNRQKVIIFDATGGKYPYFVYPASFGTPSLKVQGIPFNDFIVTTRSFTNASNNASSYNIVRFNGIQTGAAIEVTFA